VFWFRPRWARRVDYLDLTRDQMRRLESIRREVGVDHEPFVLQIVADPESTKRLQRLLFATLKQRTPLMPDRLLLARLVRNRLTAARAAGHDLFNLADVPDRELGVRVRRIVDAHPTIQSLAEAIAADQRAPAGPLASSRIAAQVVAANRIAAILAESK
jgi:hypothetical protein